MPITMRARGPCAFCGAPGTTELLLLCAGEVRAALSVCNADAAALGMGAWALTVKCMDRQCTVRGDGAPSAREDRTS